MRRRPNPEETKVQNAGKDRLAITGLVLAVLPLVICSVAGAYVTLEAFLNFLWVLLAFGAFVHWVAPGERRRRVHPSGLVGLVFVLSLLFPVISANDDLAQLDLINDAKTSLSIVSKLKSEKQLPGSDRPPDSLAAVTFQLASSLPLTSEFVSEPIHAAYVEILGDVTGNRSPPLC